MPNIFFFHEIAFSIYFSWFLFSRKWQTFQFRNFVSRTWHKLILNKMIFEIVNSISKLPEIRNNFVQKTVLLQNYRFYPFKVSKQFWICWLFQQFTKKKKNCYWSFRDQLRFKHSKRDYSKRKNQPHASTKSSLHVCGGRDSTTMTFCTLEYYHIIFCNPFPLFFSFSFFFLLYIHNTCHAYYIHNKWLMGSFWVGMGTPL